MRSSIAELQIVENSTTASHGLTQDTEDLARIVATFKLGQDAATRSSGRGGGPAPKPRVTAMPVAARKTVGRGGAAARPEAPARDEAWTEF